MANKVKPGGKLVLDPEEALRLLDNLRKNVDEFGSFFSASFVVEGSPHLPPSDGAEVVVTIPQEGWTSYETKEEAEPYVDGWRFTSDRDGNIYPEVEALINRIYESEKVERGSFIYTLSKDGKFLQRRRDKKISSEARANEFSCSELIYNQRGEPVCLHNLDAPGCCWPYCCPYGGPFKK